MALQTWPWPGLARRSEDGKARIFDHPLGEYMAEKEQLLLFGGSEKIENIAEERRYCDDSPVPCERELLWPTPHAEILGVPLLERLYGDIPRRTRLTVKEICRRLRCGHSLVYTLIEAGSLDALDCRHPSASENYYTIYRYSLVRFLFSREFVEGCSRAGLPPDDMSACMRLGDELRQERAALKKSFSARPETVDHRP